MGLTLQGATFAICTTPQVPTLDLAAFELLTFVSASGIVTMPSFRVTQNIVYENTLDTDVAEAQGGFRQGETSDLVLSHREVSDAFVVAMNAAAADNNLYAIRKILDNSLGTNGSTEFALAKITGQGGTTGGGGEDFSQYTWQIAVSSQLPVLKAAA